ncbi:MAG: hypothetical protein WBV94_19930 [Blastocatellia bacterium]
MTEKPTKFLPALVGGLVAGLLSVIPGINLGCCFWGLIGGAVAAYMLVKRSPVFRVTNGDGAVVGMYAGAIGSIIMMAVSIPLMLSRWDQVVEAMKQSAGQQNDPSAQEALNNFVAFLQNNSVAGAFMFWLIFAVAVIGMATLGGIIGVAIFEKRKGDPYPPQGPPPGYPPNFTPPGTPGGPVPPSGQPPY